MNLNEVVNAAHSKLGGSAPFTWECWGTNAQYLELVNNGQQLGSCVFDRVSGAVYAVEIFDVADNVAWRWVDSRCRDPWILEAKANDIDLTFAWESVKFIDISDLQALMLLDKMTNDPT